VLLPVLLSATLAPFHTPLYGAGGVLLLALAVLAASGRSWSLPGFIHTPELSRTDSAGSFALGLFSGVASSCCAPVLAGIMTLSALSRSLGGAAMLGLAYVFGMTFPLLLAALCWDRLRLGERRLMQARPVRRRLGGRTLHTNTLNLAVSVAFGVMGAMVLALAATGETTTAPGAQFALGRWLQAVFTRVLGWLDPVPEPVLGLGLLGVAVAIVYLGLKARPRAL
jgi:cytochrome c biogenesis protein CcdA